MTRECSSCPIGKRRPAWIVSPHVRRNRAAARSQRNPMKKKTISAAAVLALGATLAFASMHDGKEGKGGWEGHRGGVFLPLVAEDEPSPVLAEQTKRFPNKTYTD